MNKTSEANYAQSSHLENSRISRDALTVAVLGFLLGLVGHINGLFGYISLLVDLAGFVSGIAVFLIMTFNKKKEKGRLLAIAAVFLSVLAVRVMGIKDDGRDGDFGFHQRRECRQNLDYLETSLDFYQHDYAGKNPSDLKILTEYEDVPLRMLTCQATKDHKNRYKDSRFWYVYRGNDLGETSPDGLIVLHDRLETHRDGRNVLFIAAKIPQTEFGKTNEPAIWLTEKDFQKAIKRDNALRRKIGLQEKNIQGAVITP